MKWMAWCAAAGTGLVMSAAQAVPVTYSEAVSGDLPDPAISFNLGLGANTFSGTQTVAVGAGVATDRDPFNFVIQSGMQVTGLSLSWSNWVASGGTLTTPPHNNGFFSCSLLDAVGLPLQTVGTDFTDLCVSFSAAPAGSVDLFSGLMPLQAGSYGWTNLRSINWFSGQDSSWTIDYTVTINVATVPLPGTLALAGLGLLLVGLGRRRI